MNAASVAVTNSRMRIAVARDVVHPSESIREAAESSSHAREIADVRNNSSSTSLEIAEDYMERSSMHSASSSGDSDSVPRSRERSAVREEREVSRSSMEEYSREAIALDIYSMAASH